MDNELDSILKETILHDGPMLIEEWMSICLGHPENGYYTTGQPFGKQGDFTTAPEISQMFGELLGLWSAVVWQQMGAPNKVQLIELGPGRGTLMSDALRAAKGVPGFIDAISVHMVETSPVLTALQKQALVDAGVESQWHQAIEEVPGGPSIIIGNEFLDALPIRQWVKDGDHWRERCVDVIDDRFEFTHGDQVDPGDIPEVFRTASDGDIFETSPITTGIIQKISQNLCQFGGAAVFIDYGHSATGLGETLQAVKNHGFAEPLVNPGQQDLTAHVNFTAVAKAASETGARPWGPISQGDLLERLGISARATSLLASATKEQAADLASARQRLTAPDGMGRLFKAIAICHPDAPAPPGFEEVSWAD
jgi:NADH dehydrogenase [ubiquinone] 1 alpha subcomplex assembly factor 7